MAPAQSDRPIFILGCPRSGTTLVQAMLHSHPRIAIPPENRFVIPAYEERLRFGDLAKRPNRRELGRFIVARGRKFRDFGLERRETVRRVATGPATLGSALGIVLRSYAERFESPRWGDKRPLYSSYIPTLLRLFPDAQVVHVVRDPRDCVASLKRMPWWTAGTYHAVAAWAGAVDHTESAARRWPGLVARVQYERLVAEPETELRALCEALGETYDPAMVEPERVAPIAVPERKHWHANTRVGPMTERIGAWESGLEPWEVALIEAALRGRMTTLGYESTGTASPGALHLARYTATLAARRALRRSKLVKDRLDQRREPNPVSALLTTGQLAAAAGRAPGAAEPVRSQ
jgi:Sulfotransferase family